MGLMSGILGTHEYVWGLRATGHVVATEPSCTRRWVWSRRTRVGTEAFSYQVTGSVPRGMWQHQSPLMASGVHGALGYVVTPEPFPDGWHALCRGESGDTGALFWRVVCSVPRARGGAKASWHRERIWSHGADLVPTVAPGPTSGGAMNPQVGPIPFLYATFDDICT
jgi:hypothetical protein